MSTIRVRALFEYAIFLILILSQNYNSLGNFYTVVWKFYRSNLKIKFARIEAFQFQICNLFYLVFTSKLTYIKINLCIIHIKKIIALSSTNFARILLITEIYFLATHSNSAKLKKLDLFLSTYIFIMYALSQFFVILGYRRMLEAVKISRKRWRIPCQCRRDENKESLLTYCV